jgi:hypothetical protein
MPTRAQSALEYLTTYGWSVLVIAVVIVALFAVGAFNGVGSTTTSSCVAISGYKCTSPILSSSGVISFLAGQVGSTVTIVGTACSNTLNPPASIPSLPNSITIGTGQVASLNATCTLTSSALGSKFSGYLWVQYSSGTVTEIGKVITFVQTVSTQVSYPNGRIAYIPVTITNSQGSGTGSNFQQQITFAATSYTANEASDLGNIRFYQGGSLLSSWCESGCASSSSTAIFWILIPGGISANSNVLVNMTFLPTNTEYDGVHAGEASQLSGTFGAYDNIANVMNAGLIYQIYYDSSSTTVACTSYQNNLYAAKLGSSVSITGCVPTATLSSSTSAFATPGSGSSGNINGGGGGPGTESYVLINLDNPSYSGGSSYPNPPVANTAYSWLLKAVGWADFSSSTIFSVYSDDNIALGSSTTGGGDASGSDWLGGSSNPNNLIGSGWVTQGGTAYSSSSQSAGTYRLELDYAEDGGGAVTALWSSASVNYYSPTYPPGGVMPSVSFGALGH